MAASTDRFADDTFISTASLDERNFYQRATWKNVEICRSAQRQTTLSVSILPSEISQIQTHTHSFVCVGGWALGGRARFFSSTSGCFGFSASNQQRLLVASSLQFQP